MRKLPSITCPIKGVPLQLEVQVVDFLSNYTVRGLLEGFTPGEVTILLNEPIDEQRMVSVRLNSFTFEGHTLYCRPRQNQFESHVSIDDIGENGLRRAPRFPVDLPASSFFHRQNPLPLQSSTFRALGLGIEFARARGDWSNRSAVQKKRIGLCLLR